MIPLHRPGLRPTKAMETGAAFDRLMFHYKREERLRTWVLWLAVLGCTLASMLCFGWLLIGGAE